MRGLWWYCEEERERERERDWLVTVYCQPPLLSPGHGPLSRPMWSVKNGDRFLCSFWSKLELFGPPGAAWYTPHSTNYTHYDCLAYIRVNISIILWPFLCAIVFQNIMGNIETPCNSEKVASFKWDRWISYQQYSSLTYKSARPCFHAM